MKIQIFNISIIPILLMLPLASCLSASANQSSHFECYTCNSTNPLCGNRVKNSMVSTIQCPIESKCVAYINPANDYILYRGCAKHLHLNNSFQKNGCIIQNNNATYCYCDKSRCNGASFGELKLLGGETLQNSRKKNIDLDEMRSSKGLHRSQKIKANNRPTLSFLRPFSRRMTTMRKFFLTSTTSTATATTTTTSRSTITKISTPKVYQLRINDSLSKETFRRRFSLRPDQKINIIFLKVPAYNNILNENNIIQKYLTTQSLNSKFNLNQRPAVLTTQLSEWKLKNSHKKEYNLNFKCPSNGLFAHPLMCTKFLQCLDFGTMNERWYVQTCPPGLVYNQIFKYCDYEHNVHCSNWF